MNRDVLLISFSAFFADLGYQSVIAVFPIFLVTMLGAPASYFGIASAVAFGIGALFGYIGGLLSDRFNNKRLAILGNIFIPLLSLMGLAVSPIVAILLFSGGWWARNFRSPPRRALLVRASSAENRGRAFGFLHMLDIGGGMLSVVMLLALLLLGLEYSSILLITILPLIASTLLLALTTNPDGMKKSPASAKPAHRDKRVSNSAYNGIIIATALYGFSSYSLGFPILTIAQQSTSFIGIASYGVYLGVSAFTGYFIGSRKWRHIRTLGLAGYAVSGIGTLLLGIGYALNLGVAVSYLSVAIIGFGLGAIETLEPTIVSFIKSGSSMGRGMGALTGSRSVGIFAANVIMGILYVMSPTASYVYAGGVSIVAAVIVMAYGRGFSV